MMHVITNNLACATLDEISGVFSDILPAMPHLPGAFITVLLSNAPQSNMRYSAVTMYISHAWLVMVWLLMVWLFLV